VREVMPHVWAHAPGAFQVVGADPTPVVRALASDDVIIVGLVPDPGEWLQRARVHVSPLRFGAGLKLRFVDTMAAGLPFVTTTIGAEDLGLSPELTRLLVADGMVELAELALRLDRDEALWTDVSAQLRAIARDRYSFAAFGASVHDAMLHAGFPPDRLLVLR